MLAPDPSMTNWLPMISGTVIACFLRSEISAAALCEAVRFRRAPLLHLRAR